MSKITKQDQTYWSPVNGYSKRTPSPQWCAYVDGGEGNGSYDEGLHAFGYGNLMSSNCDEDYDVAIVVYQHNETQELLVELDNLNGGLSRCFVDGTHADAFLFTECLRLMAAVRRINNEDLERLRHKATIAFIRHGHGRSTINELGDKTHEEMERDAEAMVRRRREREEKQRAAQSTAQA